MALAFAWAARFPAAASAALVLVVSIIPAALGVLIFVFGAPSYAGFNMLAAAGLAVIAGVLKALAERTVLP